MRAITRQEGLEATDDEVEVEVAKVAAQVDMEIELVRERLEAADQISAIRSDIGRRNATNWMLDRMEIVDESGAKVSRDELDLDPDEDDHDHDDHDHDGHDHDHDHD